MPSVTQVITSIHKGSSGRLIVDKLENFGGHYAKTLQIWRKNFLENFSNQLRPELLKANPRISERDVEIFKRKWQVSISL